LINKSLSQMHSERAARRASSKIKIVKSHKPQAPSASKQTQKKDKIKT